MRQRDEMCEVRNLPLWRNLVGPGDDRLVSARQLAKVAGVSHQHVCNVLNGDTRRVDAAAAERIAAALGVPVRRLFAPPPCPGCGRPLPEQHEFDDAEMVS